MKIGLYPRVSTQEQAREGYSIGEQIERLQNYCAAKDWTVYKIYTDAGFSGANLNRPGLTQLIEDVENHKIDMVLVYKLDRLSRSQKDTLFLIEDVFIKNNVHFASITENFDTSTPFGRAMIGILSVFAQLEREQFRERSIMGKEARAKEGLHHGGGAPTGYDYVNGQLVINEFEAMQVREVYRLFIDEHQSINAITKIMTPYSDRWKYEVRVRDVLKNPLYAGWTHCRSELYKGQHKPIISQTVFDRAQKIFESRSRSNPDAHPAFMNNSLLSGMLWCKQCGARYFKTTKSTKRSGKKYSYEKYICYSRAGNRKYMIKDPNCKNKILDKNYLDNIVLAELRNLINNPDEIQEIIKQQRSTAVPVKKKICEKRIAEIKKQMEKLTDLYIVGGIDIDFISNKIASLNAEQTKLETEIKSLEIPKPALTVSETREKLSEISSIIDTDNIQNLRQILTTLIKRIEIDNDDIYIYWNFV